MAIRPTYPSSVEGVNDTFEGPNERQALRAISGTLRRLEQMMQFLERRQLTVFELNDECIVDQP